MALFGKNGFIRKQEIALARKLLVWQYEKSGRPLPEEGDLMAHAQKVVDDAHVIAKERGSNVLSIIKETVSNIKTNRKNKF